MRYLFFDLECATQKGGDKICEFGYVITDENFNLIEKTNLIINPNIPRTDWNYKVLRKILTRTINEYVHHDTFDKYYDFIKELIESADLIFGHSINGDMKFLNEDCKRYNLPPLTYTTYDVKTFYKVYSNTLTDTSLVHILEKMGITGDERVHDASADAYNTMIALKYILKNLKVSLKEMMERAYNAKYQTVNYKVKSIIIRKTKEEKKENNNLNHNSKRWKKFTIYTNTIEVNNFNGKIYIISRNYEDTHYKQMTNIVYYLSLIGARYTVDANLANTFVRFNQVDENNKLKPCGRYKIFVNNHQPNKENIEFSELLKRININMETLEKEDVKIIDEKK